MSISDESLAEGAKAEGDHHTVVQNLGRDIRVANVILQVAHEEKIAGGVEAIV